jgi:hypothetical protein
MGIGGRAERHSSEKAIRAGTARDCDLAASRKRAERAGLRDDRANRVAELGDGAFCSTGLSRKPCGRPANPQPLTNRNGRPRFSINSATGALLDPSRFMSRRARSKLAFCASSQPVSTLPASATTRCPSSSTISAIIIRMSASSTRNMLDAFIAFDLTISHIRQLCLESYHSPLAGGLVPIRTLFREGCVIAPDRPRGFCRRRV